MTLGLWIARTVAATILGVLVFVSFLSFMVVDHLSSKLLDAEFYTNILNEHDTYNRIYDQVLLDDAVRASTSNLLGSVRVVTHEEIVELAKEIAPPEYIQAQVEFNIGRTTKYLNYEVDTLDLLIDLGPPLARVKPVLFAEIDQRIDELELVGPDPNRSLMEQVAQARDLTESVLRGLVWGQMPETVPSVRLIPEPFRADLFDMLLRNLLNERRLDPRVRAGLESSTADLRGEFIAGDTHQFLKVAARAALTPLVDDAIARSRQDLDRQDRLDVIKTVARNSDNATEESLRYDIERFRDRLKRVQTWGETWALMVGIGATVAMVLIYLPSLTNGLRWPGLTLLLTGLVLFSLGKVLENTLPQRLNALIDSNISKISGLPPSAVDLITDITRSFGQQLVEGLAAPMLLLIILGGVLFSGSFLVVLLKPYIRGIR